MVRARDLISRRVVVVGPEERFGDAAGRIAAAGAHHCVVHAPAERRVVGVLRLAEIASHPAVATRIFADLVRGPLPPGVQMDAPAEEVAALYRGSSGEVLVMNQDAYAGLVTAESLSRWLLQQQDATRERIEEELREQKQFAALLERKVEDRDLAWRRSLGEFNRSSVILSQGLSQPLRSIEALARGLSGRAGGMLDEAVRNQAEQIARTAERLREMAEEILGKAPVGFFDRRGDIPIVSLDEVAADARLFLHRLIEERQASLEIRPGMHRVQSRYVPLLQIVVNLLANALHQVPADRRPEVELWSERVDGKVRLCVRDNGGGMPTRRTAALFRPFDHPTAAAPWSETRLSLAIAREAIGQVGGSFSVASEPGAGSVFTVTLQSAALEP